MTDGRDRLFDLKPKLEALQRTDYMSRLNDIVSRPVSEIMINHLKELQRMIKIEIEQQKYSSPNREQAETLAYIDYYFRQIAKESSSLRALVPDINQSQLSHSIWFVRQKEKEAKTPIPKTWEETMSKEEVEWCYGEIGDMVVSMNVGGADNYRAARIWISSQTRRFRKLEAKGCCGSHNWMACRWNPEKKQYDKYLLGFNYGH